MHAPHTPSRHPIAAFSSLVAKLYQISSSIKRLRVVFDPKSTLEDSFDTCLGVFNSVTSKVHFSSLQELHAMENFLVSEAYRGLSQRHPRLSPILLPPQLEKLTNKHSAGRFCHGSYKWPRPLINTNHYGTLSSSASLAVDALLIGFESMALRSLKH
jgi:hypothetical protein